MAEPKWTPGPWGCVRVRDRFPKVLIGNCFLAINEPNGSTMEVYEANARLIAAAPELYETLKYAADNIDGCLRGNDLPSLVIRDKVRAALAKARGDD